MATPSFGSGPGVTRGREEAEHGGSSGGQSGAPSRSQIEERAYSIYLAEGGGDATEHWLRAERELRAG